LGGIHPKINAKKYPTSAGAIRFIHMKYAFFLSIIFSIAACQPGNQKIGTYTEARSTDTFENYWYSGEAEVNTYALKQVRYGAIHEGRATRIFVTEPMSVDRQVKSDDPVAEKSRTVLKMNATRKFNTGVYPYSVMTSVFSPVDGAAMSLPLKLTSSIQEWCGQTFLQMNREKKNAYRYHSFSYFGSEGDQQGRWTSAMLEDGLWNQIRLEPGALPTGSIQLIPAGAYLRFQHLDLQLFEAVATVKKTKNGRKIYEVRYMDIPRILRIEFDAQFPYVIRSWEEENTNSGRMTRAELLASDKRAYWSQNGVDDRSERSELQLPENYQ